MYYENDSHWPIGTSFMMTNTLALDNWGISPGLPTPVRLYMLVTARVNKIGHAEFYKGELARLLGLPDADGVLIPMSRQNINRVIKMYVDEGVFLEGSDIRCIIMGEYAVRRDGKGSTDSCHWHSINTDKRRVRKTEKEGVVEVTPKRAVEVRKQKEEVAIEAPSEMPLKPAVVDSEPLLEPVVPETKEEVIEKPTEPLHPVLEMARDLASGHNPTNKTFWTAFYKLQDYEQAELLRSLKTNKPSWLREKLVKIYEDLGQPEGVVEEEEEPKKKEKCGSPVYDAGKPLGPCTLKLDHDSTSHYYGGYWYNPRDDLDSVA